MAKIHLDLEQVKRVKSLAKDIADDIQGFVSRHSSTSVERAILRLYGVDGVTKVGSPVPNRLIEILQEKNRLGVGASRAFASAMVESGRDAQKTAENHRRKN